MPLLSTGGRIGLAFAALAMAMFGIVAAFSARYAGRQVTEDSAQVLTQLASRMAFSLESDVRERFREVQHLAKLQPLLREELSASSWRPVVEQLQASFSHYAWLGLALPNGNVIAATGGVLQGTSVAARPWFQAAQLAPFVGGVHSAVLLEKQLPRRDAAEPLRLLDVAAPLFNQNRLVGVLGAHLDLNWAEARRRAVLKTVSEDWQVDLVVFDKDGEPLLGAPEGQRRVPSSSTEDLIRARYKLEPWSDGITYLTVAVRVPPSDDLSDLGWTVVARQRADVALATATALQWRIIAFGAMGALAFGLLAWWLATALTAPLRHVATQALEMAQLGKSVPKRGVDEVEQLSRALGDLVGQLRQREQQLLTLNQSLEDRVRQRTAALELANDDLRSFSHGVSHDLKAPIGSIAAAIRLVLQRMRGDADPVASRTLELLLSECDRIRLMIDEFLTLAMLEQRTLQNSPVDVKSLVAAVVSDVRAQIQAGAAVGSVQTVVELDDLPTVQGDGVLLRQVWHNLIANAFKFSSRSTAPTVRISGRRTDTEVEFTVQDNGVGFDQTQANRLFGLFQRLHSASDYPGTGVGLSLVKRIVARHGGRAWATSQPGHGATFGFSMALQE